ncbi:hypothetical protein J5J10_09680 [Ciceribacter sp. L1K23]|uniref:DUF2946 family protein n=1 Tax=Ciceribacter sp. L1K23 TaxID=2820276 RepID=UPI001B829348|nr:hypothetical protein [Ciceribacter sp. L1K23]MBR0555947.1 hypothetical protein [Ciceribacter sp. L1K23]
MTLDRKRAGISVRILCAIALLFVGLAHKTPVIASQSISTAELAQYVLPDGTIPVLCLDDEGTPHGHDVGTGCDACLLSASILLPAPQDEVGRPVAHLAEVFAPFRAEAFYRQLFPPNAAPRAPPIRA